MKSITGFALTSFLSCFLLTPASAGSLGGPGHGDGVLDPSTRGGLLLQVAQCRQEVWSATQSTAWNKYRQAQSQGYSVSNGVFPCYQYGTRGYCFVVFYTC